MRWANRTGKGKIRDLGKTIKPVCLGSDDSHEAVPIAQEHTKGIASLSPSKLFNFVSSLLLCYRSVSIVVIKHYDKKQLGEERVYFTLQILGHTPVCGGSQGKNSRGTWR